MAHLKFDMRLFTDRYLRAHVGILLVLGQEFVATCQDISKPSQYFAIVADLTLDQFLTYVV